MNTEELTKSLFDLRKLKIEHREYMRVLEEAYTEFALAEPATVVMVVGPTNVGKSRVCEVVSDRLVPKNPDAVSRYRHLITVQAANVNAGEFSMKNFTLRALEEVRHPIYGESESMESAMSYVPRTRTTEGNLRLALEKAMKYRQTKWFNIDEAHHILKVRGEDGPANILDSLKCLGNTTGAVIGFFGGYELLLAGLKSAHLNGRMRIINFPPYYASIQDDVDEFDRVIDLIDRVLPRKDGFSLLHHRDVLREGSVGCVGLLKRWADAALVRCIARRNTDGLTIEHFECTRFEEQIALIKEEVKLGRSLLTPITFVADSEQVPSPSNPRKAKREKPFQRNPVRDPVGSLEE